MPPHPAHTTLSVRRHRQHRPTLCDPTPTMPNTQHPDPLHTVIALCRRTGLSPDELACILAEIRHDDVRGYRVFTLAKLLPEVVTAYLHGGYAACAAPDVRPMLARAYVASWCHANGAQPSALANAACHLAGHGTANAAHAPEYAEAMWQEMGEHVALTAVP
jgi:hypothetical protein